MYCVSLCIHTQVQSVREWLSSAAIINICISIVLTWLNTNSSISGLAGAISFFFKTNIHTYWYFYSSDSRLRHSLLPSFFLLENITFVFLFPYHIFPLCLFYPSSACFLSTKVLVFNSRDGNSLCQLVGPSLWSRLNFLNNYCIHCLKKIVQTFIVPRGWILIILVSPQFFLQCQQQPRAVSYPVKYLNQIRYWHSRFPENVCMLS